MEFEVALVEILRAEGGVVAVDAAFDGGAEDEHRRGGAVVGAVGGVLLHAAAELGEGHDHGFFVVALGFEVFHESADAVGEGLHEAVVGLFFVGVGVEAAEGDIVDAGFEAAGDHLGDHLELLAERRGGVGDAAFVFGGDGEDFITGELSVQRGAFEEVEGGIAGGGEIALGLLEIVHLVEGVAHAFVDGAVAGEPLVGLGILEGDGGELVALERERGGVADVDGGLGIGLGLGVGAVALGVEVAAEPAVFGGIFGIGGLPDFHGAEVGAVGVGIADALDDGHLSGVVEVFEGGEVGVEGDGGCAEGEQVGAEADGGAGAAIVIVVERGDGGEAVVAAGELDDDEGLFALAHGGLGEREVVGVVEGEDRALEEEGHGSGGGEEREAAGEESTAGVEGRHGCTPLRY